jgi:hypothetical protein
VDLGGIMLAGSRLETRDARRGCSDPAAVAAGVIVTILDADDDHKIPVWFDI